jgi:hypothetical protein
VFTISFSGVEYSNGLFDLKANNKCGGTFKNRLAERMNELLEVDFQLSSVSYSFLDAAQVGRGIVYNYRHLQFQLYCNHLMLDVARASVRSVKKLFSLRFYNTQQVIWSNV